MIWLLAQVVAITISGTAYNEYTTRTRIEETANSKSRDVEREEGFGFGTMLEVELGRFI